mgnify:FL=1
MVILISNIIIASEAVAKSALLREESRGAHTRLDFEGEREEWGNINIVVRNAEDGSMEVEQFTRDVPPEHLAEIAYSNLDDLEGGIHV